MKHFYAFMFLIFSLSALGGGEAGNGGNFKDKLLNAKQFALE